MFETRELFCEEEGDFIHFTARAKIRVSIRLLEYYTDTYSSIYILLHKHATKELKCKKRKLEITSARVEKFARRFSGRLESDERERESKKRSA